MVNFFDPHNTAMSDLKPNGLNWDFIRNTEPRKFTKNASFKYLRFISFGRNLAKFGVKRYIPVTIIENLLPTARFDALLRPPSELSDLFYPLGQIVTTSEKSGTFKDQFSVL